jgi:hypothetical protein
MYLGEPAERVEVKRGGLIHVDAMTPLQTVNHETDDLVLYAYGYTRRRTSTPRFSNRRLTLAVSRACRAPQTAGSQLVSTSAAGIPFYCR